jgi:hypothetical protein
LEKLERDRSLADGRLKHQRTDRTIEHVFDLFLTCPLGFALGQIQKAWGQVGLKGIESLGQVLKDETSPIPTAVKASGDGKGIV